jgi:hypothetical protein
MKVYGRVVVYIHIFLTSALGGGEWSASCPGRFAPTRKELVWMTWRRENSLPYWDLNSDPSVVQPVASRYTNYAI